MHKTMKTMLRVALAAVAICGFGKAYAFHSGGVAECGGCHSMHNPNLTYATDLLIGDGPSETCLECHGESGQSSYHVKTPTADLGPGQAPYNETPGGDFGWLNKDYIFVVRNSTTYEMGHEFGHNVVAPAFDLDVDASNAAAPGGTFASAQLACNSCHDQHGQYRRLSTGAVVRGGYFGQALPTAATAPIVGSGSYNNSWTPLAGQAVGVYRLLWGAGASVDGVTFSGVPLAFAPSSYNRTEVTIQTRVSYGVGAAASGYASWGNWCATCHPDMHSSGNYVHPVDQSMSALIPVYNAYVSSGDLSGSFTGDHTNQGPFLSLVPFVKNSGDIATVQGLAGFANNAARLAGPADGDQVSCLSCHRAHATGFPWMLKWQMEGEFITVATTLGASGVAIWPGTDNGAPAQFARGRTEAEQRRAYYDRPATTFGIYQRVLCNKCHGKD